jgi:putative tryptophan/tyrosine transport system substrate-binding protein
MTSVMHRRAFLCGVALVTSAVPLAAEVQQAGKVYRVGWLAPESLPTTLDAFRDGLRVFGYVEGNNLVIEQRYANGKPERLAGLVAELVGTSADVIVTTGNPATAATKTTAGSTPVVFVAGDPVEAGFVASLARPGGNMTGVNTLPGELNAKRLELLREAFPTVSRVAVLFEPRHLSSTIPQIEAAARSLGLRVIRLEVHGVYDFERAFGAAARSQAGALMPVSSALFHGERQRIVRLAAKHRLPAMYEHRDFAEAGGLLSYGPDILFLNRRVATYVDKIFKGAKPADLPVEQPTKFELVINLKTTRALALTIPQTILLRAAEVIE